MFTGLVERTGEWLGLSRSGNDWEAAIGVEGGWLSPLVIGESISVNGACLTVVRDDGDRFVCNLLEETLRRTALQEKVRGNRVNLERALALGDRLGGHLVQGHVDGTGVVREVTEDRGDRVVRVACDAALLQEMIPKGSVACDGVSLTIAKLDDTAFQVNVIPHTWEQTALRELRVGSPVNIETDLLGKYVRRGLEGQGRGTIDMKMLGEAGFA